MTEFEKELEKFLASGRVTTLDSVERNNFSREKQKFIEKYNPKPLPVIPKNVAYIIHGIKHKNNIVINCFGYEEKIEDIYKFMFFIIYECKFDKDVREWVNNNRDTFARAWLDGYTIEEEKKYYLKDKLTGQFLARTNLSAKYFWWNEENPLIHKIGTAWDLKFTQEEIDSMAVGSYEKIEVGK